MFGMGPGYTFLAIVVALIVLEEIITRAFSYWSDASVARSKARQAEAQRHTVLWNQATSIARQQPTEPAEPVADRSLKLDPTDT